MPRLESPTAAMFRLSRRTTPPAALALVVAGQRRSIDLTSLSGNGPWNFAAAIPEGATDVDLELSAAGYVQDFSLMTLTRVGPQPAVLYRDPDDPEVAATDSSAKSVPVIMGPPVSETYGVSVGVFTTLGWFAPDAALDTPTSTDQAILSVQLNPNKVIDPAGNFVVQLMIPDPVPADHVHWSWPMAPASTPPLWPRPIPTYPGSVTTCSFGTYYFTVPACGHYQRVAVHPGLTAERPAPTARRHPGHRPHPDPPQPAATSAGALPPPPPAPITARAWRRCG